MEKEKEGEESERARERERDRDKELVGGQHLQHTPAGRKLINNNPEMSRSKQLCVFLRFLSLPVKVI